MQIFSFVQGHWMLVAAFVFFVIAYAIFEIRQYLIGPKRLTPSLATQFMNHHHPFIIDLRDKTKFESGHIINAQVHPQNEVQAVLEKLKKPLDTPILLVCQTGQHSAVLGARLKKQGFTEVMSLSGGMNAWQNADLPVEKRGK